MVITEKKENKSGISYIPGTSWDKVTDFNDDPMVPCDFRFVKIASLDNGDNDDRK